MNEVQAIHGELSPIQLEEQTQENHSQEKDKFRGLDVVPKPQHVIDAELAKDMPRMSPKAESNSNASEPDDKLFGKKVKYVGNTTPEDVELFNALLSNKGRARPSYAKSMTGANDKSTKTTVSLDFLVGKHGDRMQSTGRKVIIENPRGRKSVEIVWYTNVEGIRDNWKYDTDIIPKPSEIKIPHHEKLGITEHELNRRKFESKLDDLPTDKLEKLFAFIDQL